VRTVAHAQARHSFENVGEKAGVEILQLLRANEKTKAGFAPPIESDLV